MTSIGVHEAEIPGKWSLQRLKYKGMIHHRIGSLITIKNNHTTKNSCKNIFFMTNDDATY